MFAVVSVGGRQFKVRPGTLIRAARMKAPLQGKVTLPVLAIGGKSRGASEASSGGQTGDETSFQFAASKDGLEKAQATALTVNHGRGKKILVFKKKRRKGYRRTKGFRETYTDLLVLEIKLPSGKILKAPERKPTKSPPPAKTGSATALASSGENPKPQ